jgi:hypothetical protein
MLDPASPAGALEAADRALESFVYRMRVVAADRWIDLLGDWLDDQGFV